MNQINKMKVVNSQVTPRGRLCHKIIVFDYSLKIITELIESEVDAYRKHHNKNVAIAPREGLKQVNPLKLNISGFKIYAWIELAS